MLSMKSNKNRKEDKNTNLLIKIYFKQNGIFNVNKAKSCK